MSLDRFAHDPVIRVLGVWRGLLLATAFPRRCLRSIGSNRVMQGSAPSSSFLRQLYTSMMCTMLRNPRAGMLSAARFERALRRNEMRHRPRFCLSRILETSATRASRFHTAWS